MLRWRLLLGAVYIAALVGLVLLDMGGPRPGIYLALLAIFVGWLASGELVAMYRAGGHNPPKLAIKIATLLPIVVSSFPILLPKVVVAFPTVGAVGWVAIGLAVGMGVVLLTEMIGYEKSENATVNTALAALSVLHIGGCLGLLVQLRLQAAPMEISGLRGVFPLLTLIVTVKLSDICQYVVGKLFGKHKMAPIISPGKTWEGSIGGVLLASGLAAWGMDWIMQHSEGMHPVYFPCVIGYTLSIAVAGLMGDLAESLLKRDAGVKDSSNWMPGFGGVFDLIDSLLLAAPVGYLWWAIGVLGP